MPKTNGRPCPACGGESRVVKTRHQGGPLKLTVRRHECRLCLYRWTSEQKDRGGESARAHT